MYILPQFPLIFLIISRRLNALGKMNNYLFKVIKSSAIVLVNILILITIQKLSFPRFAFFFLSYIYFKKKPKNKPYILTLFRKTENKYIQTLTYAISSLALTTLNNQNDKNFEEHFNRDMSTAWRVPSCPKRPDISVHQWTTVLLLRVEFNTWWNC
jgi:hypothetical protein